MIHFFQKIINFGIYLIALSLPLYLVQFRIFWIPTNLLELMIYGLFVLWLAKVVISRTRLKISLEDKSWFYAVFLIFLGVTISTLFSVDLEKSAGIWKGWFIVPLFFGVVLIDSLKNKAQIKNLILALTLSGVAVAWLALFYWGSNQLTYDGRLRAFYLSPNHLAMYLSPILILSFYLYFCFKRKLPKILLFVVHCFLFFVIYLTFSYGAWLGVVAALIFLLVIQRKGQGFIRPLIGFILLLVVLSFIWQIPGQKFQAFLSFSRSSLESRLVIWQSALEIIKDHSLIGIGPGMFQKYYLDYQSKFKPYLEWAVPQPHNLFLAFWLQAGLIGLIGFNWLLVVFFRNGLGALKTQYSKWPNHPKPSNILNSILLAAMIYILIHGLVDTPYWKNDLSIIFWLITALSYRVSCRSY